jgi:hypothetical protein
MPFALCMDPWSVKDANGNLLPSPAKEAAMIAALQSQDMQLEEPSFASRYAPRKRHEHPRP